MTAERTNTLKENFIWTFSGNAFYAFSQWLILMVLARKGDPVMVGQFALAMALTAPVILFSNLKLRDIQATDIRNEYSFRQYFSLRASTVAIAIVMTAAIAFAGGYRMNTIAIILLVACVKGVESISDIIYGRHQQKENMRLISVSLILKGAISVPVFYIAMNLTGSILWGCTGLLLTRLFILLAYDLRTPGGAVELKLNTGRMFHSIKSVSQSIKGDRKLIELLRISLPLGVVALTVSLIPNLPSYMLESFHGEYQLGLYSSMLYLQVIGNTAIIALGQSVSPKLSRLFISGNMPEFSSLLLRLILYALALGLLGVAAAEYYGEEILALLLGSTYSPYTYLFILIMISTGISYVVSFTGFALIAIRKYSAQLWINLAVIVFAAVSGFALISTRGAAGAAYCLIYTMLLQSVLNLSVVFYTIYKTHNLRLLRDGIHI